MKSLKKEEINSCPEGESDEYAVSEKDEKRSNKVRSRMEGILSDFNLV